MKTSFLSLVLTFTLFIICLAPASLRAENKNGHNREITAGIFNFDGYHSKDENGDLEGYGIDLLDLLSEYSHLNFRLTGYENSWKDMQEMLKNGKIDIVSSARRNPEREKVFAFSLPVGRNHTILAKQENNSNLRAGDYSTYDGMKIGAVTGSSQNRYIVDFAKDKGFDYTLIEFESTPEMEDALQTGQVDAILSSNLRKPKNETLLDVIKSDNFYIIARKEDQDIIDEINQAIEEMNLNEGDWQNALFYRYYGTDESKIPDFSIRETEFINDTQKKGAKIRAIARGDRYPYSYVENGELKGILPDYFAKLMQTADLPFELIAPKDEADYRNRINNNEVEVVLDLLGSKRTGKKDPVSGFATDPYLVTGLATVTRMNFNGPVRTLALPDTTPLTFRPSLLKDVSVKRFPTAEAAMRAVQECEADAAYVLPFSALYHINSDPGSSLFYTMMEDNGANFRMYLPASENHELVTIIKKAMKRLPDSALNQLSSQYLSVAVNDMTLFQYLRANPGILVVGALVLTIGAALLFITWLRGRWNKRLLETTEEANHALAGQLAIVEALSRDYSNVLSINGKSGMTQFVKISRHGGTDGSVVPGAKHAYGDIISDYVKSYVHPEDREYVTKAMSLENIRAQLADSDEYKGTYRILKNGETRYFQFNFVKPHGKSVVNDNLILAGIRNIDEVIKREQKQKKALAEALAQSRYASAAKTAFLNNMSHDIRTPMNAIIGFTNLASANAENKHLVKRYLGKILTSGNHLLSLINDVLDMSRIESGKVKIEEQKVHLPDILHDLRTIAQADVKAKQLDFQIDTLDVVNETIYCDRLRLNQILLNILSNAMKYTHPGGKVSVRVRQVAPAVDGKATYEFSVRDSGIGMSAEFLKHVFEPFEREQTTTVSGIQGTGLGLAITKKIVDMMAGKIEVQSEQGKGSEFSVTFDFKVEEEEEKEKRLPQYEGKRALVVDDDINACTSLSKMLSEMGLRPDWTTLGKEALVRTQFAREQNDSYSVYLVDWIMTDMNGIELARRLRKAIPESAPIIMLTAYDWTDIEEEGREAGITGFCSKPVFFSELREILSKPAKEVKEEVGESNFAEEFKGKKILLAEDNEMNQEIAQMILENAGFMVEIVENGQQAVDKITSEPANAYDLILMDVQMPIMNGYDATKAIRKLEDRAKADIPIIAMTANAFDEDREEALKSGMNAHVPKPINIKELMETLEDVIKKVSAPI